LGREPLASALIVLEQEQELEEGHAFPTGPGRSREANRARRRWRAGRETTMKKLLVLVLLGLAGLAVWRKVEADRAEQALWAEVTDPATDSVN
jgi:hypothetical protein